MLASLLFSFFFKDIYPLTARILVNHEIDWSIYRISYFTVSYLFFFLKTIYLIRTSKGKFCNFQLFAEIFSMISVFEYLKSIIKYCTMVVLDNFWLKYLCEEFFAAPPLHQNLCATMPDFCHFFVETFLSSIVLGRLITQWRSDRI